MFYEEGNYAMHLVQNSSPLFNSIEIDVNHLLSNIITASNLFDRDKRSLTR